MVGSHTAVACFMCASFPLLINCRPSILPDRTAFVLLDKPKHNRCGRAKEWKRATEMFDEARYVHRIRPSLQIYGALLSCLADGKQWADVLMYSDRMVTDGIVPDAVATNMAVLAAAELGDGRRALSLLEGEAAYGRLGRRKRQRQQGVARDIDVVKGEGYSNDLLQQGRQKHRQRIVVGQKDEGGGSHCTVGIGQAVEAQEDMLLLGKRRSRRSSAKVVGGGGTREQSEGGSGGVAVRAVVEGHVVSSDGGGTAAAEVQGSTAAGRPSTLAGEEVFAGAADGVEAGESNGEGENALADRAMGGGWETATPGLLNSVLHALYEAGEDAVVLEAVKRGREEGVLLNPSIYR